MSSNLVIKEEHNNQHALLLITQHLKSLLSIHMLMMPLAYFPLLSLPYKQVSGDGGKTGITAGEPRVLLVFYSFNSFFTRFTRFLGDGLEMQ
jgi:hypothetical protein